MEYIFIGLGNPSDEYKDTRHNAGRIMLEAVLSRFSDDDISWEEDKKTKVLVFRNKKPKLLAVLPQTFMNKSGDAVARYVKSKKTAGGLVVFHDDLDLPLGTVRLAWNKGDGGHRGLKSVIKSVGTQEFLRIRIGISPAGAKGRARKLVGEEKVLKHILSKFKPEELRTIKKLSALTAEALLCMIKEGREKAMSLYNAKT